MVYPRPWCIAAVHKARHTSGTPQAVLPCDWIEYFYALITASSETAADIC